MKKLILINLMIFFSGFIFAQGNDVKLPEILEKPIPARKKEVKKKLNETELRKARLKVRAERKQELLDLIDLKKEGDKVKVRIIPLKTQVDQMLFFFLKRSFEEAEFEGVDIVIIDMDTPGGYLHITDQIVELYRKFPGMVYTFINKKAQSAGSMLSLGSDGVYMAKGSRVGSAMPIIIVGGEVKEVPADYQEKMLSDTRAMLRGLAEENGYDPILAMAFADNKIEVKKGDEVICEEGKLLNLTAKEATKIYKGEPLFSDGIVDDPKDLLKKIGVNNFTISTAMPNTSEKIAKIILTIGPLLGILTLLCIYLEINSPGFGVPGIVGVTCFILMTFGYNIAGYANFWEILLLFVGFVLLAVEAFVIPGFGVAGISGLICIAIGGLLMMMPDMPDMPETPGLETTVLTYHLNIALKNFVIMGVGTIVGGYFLSKVIRKSSFYNKLLLSETISAEAGYTSTNVEHDRALLNKEGLADTDLRPAGIVMIGNERIDVVSEGTMIRKGETVKVIKVEGRRIVVEKIS